MKELALISESPSYVLLTLLRLSRSGRLSIAMETVKLYLLIELILAARTESTINL